jgi:ABC-type transport system involved in multi-copper enzyme maturation permease subunit
MKHMDSTAEAAKLGPRIMPYLAILQHDLMTLRASRLVRLWFGATVVLTLLLMAANWTRFQSAPLIASLLFPYLVFPWFFVVVALGVSPVSGSQTDVVADGILSRPVSRSAYLLATWSARVVLIWGVYLVVIVPAVIVVTLAKRPVPDDTVTIYGIVSAMSVVGLVLTFLTSLAFLAGTLLRGPLLALVVLVFLWYPVGLILSVFSLVLRRRRSGSQPCVGITDGRGGRRDLEPAGESFSVSAGHLVGAGRAHLGRLPGGDGPGGHLGDTGETARA